MIQSMLHLDAFWMHFEIILDAFGPLIVSQKHKNETFVADGPKEKKLVSFKIIAILPLCAGCPTPLKVKATSWPTPLFKCTAGTNMDGGLRRDGVNDWALVDETNRFLTVKQAYGKNSD